MTPTMTASSMVVLTMYTTATSMTIARSMRSHRVGLVVKATVAIGPRTARTATSDTQTGIT
jgi:hypothetical protein